MKISFVCWLLTATIGLPSINAQISPGELLDKSIAYHDPKDILRTKAVNFELSETRPNGSDRETTLQIDYANASYSIDRIVEGRQIVYRLHDGIKTFILDGQTDFSEEEREKFNLNEGYLDRMKDYYRYLWFLPVTLKDSGTILHSEIRTVDFFQRESLELKVTYNPDVGGDTWYFYFHPTTYALIGYRFYHDESKNDGEYILLEGEVAQGKLRIPAKRSWFTHQDDRLLGTDTLLKVAY